MHQQRRNRWRLKWLAFLMLIDGTLLVALDWTVGWLAPPFHRRVASQVARRPAQGKRFFLFGESTIYGFPYGDGNSTACWLQEVLRDVAGNSAIEVVNFGRPARGSFHLERAVKETVSLRPDGVILCLGHNEFLARSIALAEDPRHRWCYFHLNLYRLGYDRITDWRSRGDAARREQELGDGIAPVSPLAARVRLHFVRNLERMLSYCQQAGVPVIVAIPAANLLWPPRYAPRDAQLGFAQRHRVSLLLHEAEQRLRRGETAAPLLTEAERLSPDDAAVQYARGWDAWQRGERAAALAALERARDLDRLPVRCQGPLLQAATDLCHRFQVPLVDLPRCFADLPTAPVGTSWFVDNCHPRPWGQYLIACALAREMLSAGWLPAGEWSRLPGWPVIAGRLSVDWEAVERRTFFSLVQLWPEWALELAETPPAGVLADDPIWRTFRLIAAHACGRSAWIRQQLAETGGWPAVPPQQVSDWPAPVQALWHQARSAHAVALP